MKVTIVGAGIVGYAIAYELAVQGAHVRLVDPRGSGQGATRASAGVLGPYIEGHSAPLLRLGLCALDHYDDFIARVSADAQRRIEYRRSGTLQVARSDGEARRLEQAAQTLSAAGVSHTSLDGDEARRLEPSLAEGIRAGLLVPQHGYVGVATLMSALVEAARRHGATLSTARVNGIDLRAGSLTVETSEDTFASDAVVLAAGSWSGAILMTPAVSPPVRPVRGQLLHLRFARPPLSRVVWGTATYLVPWEDGSVLVGATVEDAGFDERVTAAGVHQLLEGAVALLPVARSATFDEARAGLRPATADELPIIGRSSTMRDVYYATGHYRNGVLLAPLTATMIADLVLHGRARGELALVRPDRFGL
ncbi:MAG: glycine oxidase ThiO [Acidobacteria bacterium]|nr:glycine oxidase ThiO [Acidobacteriota bacterium]